MLTVEAVLHAVDDMLALTTEIDTCNDDGTVEQVSTFLEGDRVTVVTEGGQIFHITVTQVSP